MAKTTYTVVMQCHRCDRETTQTGVRLKGEYEYGSVECHCQECGATGTASLLYREIHRPCGASVGFDTVASDSFRASAIVTREPPPIEAHTGLILDHSDAGVGPAADEWSKPVKDEHGSFEAQLKRGGFVDRRAKLEDGDLMLEGDEFAWAPRDVVLRLLAAEASDRLGWAWAPDADNDGRIVGMDVVGGSNYVIWRESGVVAVDAGDFTPDELLAVHHGYFLLQDALREAGQ